MKYKLTFYALLLFSTFLTAQWKPVNTFPQAEWLYCVFFTDDDHGWIAGQKGTILKFNSLDFCWLKIQSGTENDLKSIAFFDNYNGIAAGKNGTLLQSKDGGMNWSPVYIFTPNNLNKIFCLNKTTAYICGANGTLLKTSDKGNTFTQIATPSVSAFTSVCFTDSLNGFCGTDSSSIFKTTDGGNTWNKNFLDSYNDILPQINSIIFTDSEHGFAYGGNSIYSGLSFKTTDAGETWFSGIHAYFNIWDAYQKDSSTCITVGGSYSWNRFLIIQQNNESRYEVFHSEAADITSITVTPSGKGWAVGGLGGILYAENYLKDWRQIFSGCVDITMSLSVSDDKYFFLASCRADARTGLDLFLRSSADKKLWKDISPYNETILKENELTFNNLYMIDSLYGYSLADHQLRRTSDGLKTVEYLPVTWCEGIFFHDKKIGWSWRNGYAEDHGIFKTVDSGKTLTKLYTQNFNLTDLKFTDENVGYACGSGNDLIGKMIKSTDGGETWTVLNIPLTSHLTTVAFTNKDTGIVTGWGNTLLKTNDGGKTWINITAPVNVNTFTNISSKIIQGKNDKRYILLKTSDNLYKEIKVNSEGNYTDAVFIKNKIFVASDSGFVLTSTDYGSTWNKINIGFPVLQIVYDGVQYAAARTRANVFLFNEKTHIPVAISQSEKSSQIKGYALEQNYPNPFNPLTTIKYSIEKEGKVTLILYDILGAKVQILVNEHQDSGEYNVILNASSLPSGVYFYRLESGNYHSTKKLIFLK